MRWCVRFCVENQTLANTAESELFVWYKQQLWSSFKMAFQRTWFYCKNSALSHFEYTVYFYIWDGIWIVVQSISSLNFWINVQFLGFCESCLDLFVRVAVSKPNSLNRKHTATSSAQQHLHRAIKVHDR